MTIGRICRWCWSGSLSISLVFRCWSWRALRYIRRSREKKHKVGTTASSSASHLYSSWSLPISLYLLILTQIAERQRAVGSTDIQKCFYQLLRCVLMSVLIYMGGWRDCCWLAVLFRVCTRNTSCVWSVWDDPRSVVGRVNDRPTLLDVRCYARC